MKIFSFIQKLFPSLEKSAILRTIKQVRQELNDFVLPLLVAGAEFFKEVGFKAESSLKLQKYFDTLTAHNHNYSAPNFLGVLSKVADGALKQLNIVEKLLDKEFGDTIVRDGITFYKAALLQHLQAIHFFAQYNNRLLSFIYSEEAAVLGAKSSLKALSPEDLRYLESHRDEFFAVVKVLMTDERNIEHQLSKVPDAVANEDTANTIQAVNSRSMIDPFGFGSLGFNMGWIYSVGKAWAEYQVAEFKEMEEQAAIIETKLLHLRNLRDGTHNPKLEQTIVYNEGRLQKIKLTLKKLSEDYAEN